ncbi:MAG: MFS transporter [Promethearchaeota archaeon]|nr:MAG: MFS transporter [Candidatus Lokiarchaeota archaeon]
MSNEGKKPNKKSADIEYSSKIHFSYSLGGFLIHFLAAAMAVRIIFFYENLLLLNIVLIGIAFVIFGFWNMINDPIIGYLSDKNYRFTEKWGRRFPWFISTVFPSCVFYLLIFIVPLTDTLGIFLWLLIILCAFEFAFSAWNTTYLALFPEKFKSTKERIKVGGYSTILGQIGLALGILLPPLFIKPNNLNSYILAALMVMTISIIIGLLMIPGMRGDKGFMEYEIKQIERDSFLNVLKNSLKQKNFRVYLFVYLAHSILTVMMLASIPFWTVYIISSESPTTTEILLAGIFLMGGTVSVPLWVKAGRKYGNRKGFMYGTFLTSIFFIPLLFLTNLMLTLIVIGLLGAGIGAIWTLIHPCFSDVIDESIILTNTRQEAFYTGIRTFTGRFAIVIQGIAFALVHTLTYYKPGAEIQSPLAVWGIRVLMALIPMIFYLVAFIMMWKIYDLTPEKVLENQNLLKKRGF